MKNLIWQKFSFACLPLLAGLLLVAGCGSPAQPDAPAQAQPAEKAGEFPADIPIYEGLARDYVSDSGPLLVVNGTTVDSIEKVAAFYRERLAANGWSEGHDPTVVAGNGGETLVYVKGPAKMVILISEDEGKTRVSLQVEGYVAR